MLNWIGHGGTAPMYAAIKQGVCTSLLDDCKVCRHHCGYVNLNLEARVTRGVMQINDEAFAWERSDRRMVSNWKVDPRIWGS